jgi:hypothetical protein
MSDMVDMVIEMASDPRTMYPTPMDRHRDFQQVFSTDAGSRVFKEIMILGRMMVSNAAKGDPYETYLREGKRDLAIAIAKVTFEEPKAQPDRQVSTNPQER